jgi:hypothetical protein
VCALETGVAQGSLLAAEVFVFTDNATAESVFYKGNTSSRCLFDLVLRLQALEMQGQLVLHVHHVAGTRMIAQGTNGLSRGVMTEGVMAGQPMVSFVPLHLDALDQHPAVLTWIQDWMEQPHLQPLTPTEWFTKGHGYTNGVLDSRGIWLPQEIFSTWCLWSPPPAAADVAIDELLTSRHKRPHLNHVFIAPRLSTHSWRKKLFKASDIVFKVPPGSRSFWPSSAHEPLIIGLTLRLLSIPPWQLRQSKPILALGRELQSMWSLEDGAERLVLRKLSSLPARLESM